MTDLFSYTLSALLAIALSPFLFRGKMSIPLRGALLAMVLLLDELFVCFSFSLEYAYRETMPFRMLALSLCFSTLFLESRRRFFGMLSTALWLWIDFFGMLSLSYRGESFRLLSLVVVVLSLVPFALESRKREARFVQAVFWAVAWMFSFAR